MHSKHTVVTFCVCLSIPAIDKTSAKYFPTTTSKYRTPGWQKRKNDGWLLCFNEIAMESGLD